MPLDAAPLDAELNARLQLAIAAAREAGNLTLDYFQRDDVNVELKADASPVTVADLSPGEHGDYDLYSFGADGARGGEGKNADIESWNLK